VDERQGETFAEMVDEAAIRLDYNDYQLAGAVGLLPGKKVVSSKQIARLRAGEMRNYPRPLVARLIEILGLDTDPETGLKDPELELKAWKAADRWPPGLDPEDVISELRATRTKAASRVASQAEGAHVAAAASSSSDPTTLMPSYAPAAGQRLRKAA